jgi:hypothetical protein
MASRVLQFSLRDVVAAILVKPAQRCSFIVASEMVGW